MLSKKEAQSFNAQSTCTDMKIPFMYAQKRNYVASGGGVGYSEYKLLTDTWL
jgi:hypothetical protein